MTCCVKLRRLSVFRESFALVKGAVLQLEEGDREGFHDETSPVTEGDGASDTRHRHLRAMVEQLRPEDTVKLVRLYIIYIYICSIILFTFEEV